MDNETSQETNTNDTGTEQVADSKFPEEDGKNLGGRPLKFKTPEEMQEKIDAYYKSCWDYKRDMFGNRIKDKETGEYVMFQKIPYTITGLACHLDTTRDVLLDYQEKDEFSNTIKKAKQRCHAFAEESLFVGKNPSGAIFNLKNNYGWKDQNQTQLTGDKENPLIVNVIRKNGNNNTP